MSAERFRGLDLTRVADTARRSLGDDVMILHTRTVRNRAGAHVEVLAAPGREVEMVRARLSALFGAGARLVIEPNVPHGVVAAIEIPR